MRADELTAVLEREATRTADGILEEVGTIPISGYRSMYVLVRPIGKGNRVGVVICPSMFEIWMLQAAETRLARAAAARGFAVLYVQPPGTGDSEGLPESCLLSTRVDTALAGCEYLKARVPEINDQCFFGARLGGAVATLAAAAEDRPTSLVLWDPAFDIVEYWRQTRRLARIQAVMAQVANASDPLTQIRDTGTALAFGVRVTAQQLQDLERLRSEISRGSVSGPALAVCLDETKAREAVTDLRGVVAGTIDHVSFQRRDVLHLGLRHYDRVVEPTLKWMSSRLV